MIPSTHQLITAREGKSNEAATALQSCRQRLNAYAHRTYAQEGLEFPTDSDLAEGNLSEDTEEQHDIEQNPED